MRSRFSQYIVDKFSKKRYEYEDYFAETSNPIITISREYGCGASNLTKKLCEALSNLPSPDGKIYKWRIVNHEVLANAAAELGVSPEIVNQISYRKLKDYEVSSFFDITFSKYNKPSIVQVRNTLARVMFKFAQEGHVIILGRGGASLTRNYRNAIHLRLHAPIEWRVIQVSQREHFSKEKAMIVTRNLDKERHSLRTYFEGKTSDKTLFDLIFNSKTMSDDDIVETTLAFCRRKGFIK